MNKKCCGNCKRANEGTCYYAGEISTNYVCDKYEAVKLCDFGGDADHCENCAYYPEYKYDEKTGECRINKGEK